MDYNFMAKLHMQRMRRDRDNILPTIDDTISGLKQYITKRREELREKERRDYSVSGSYTNQS